MIAYKATYNFKCRNQIYRVGKTYTSNKLEMCNHGFHFCKKMEDTLNYYGATENFILLEIEILGTVIDKDNKSVTDKIKVLRVVPFEEYTDEMKSQFPKLEYDERNNLISKTFPDDNKYTYEYDERNNLISKRDSSGYKIIYEYDERNNLISATYPDGSKYTYQYDSNNNRISETNSTGAVTSFERTIVTEE